MEPPSVLHYPRSCGCKGIRRCLTCESDFSADVDGRTEMIDDEPSFCSFVFCTHCSIAYFAQMEKYEEKDCGWHERLGNGKNGAGVAVVSAVVVLLVAAIVAAAVVEVAVVVPAAVIFAAFFARMEKGLRLAQKARKW